MTEDAANLGQEDGASPDTAKISPRWRWTRNLFTCLAFSFPLYWMAQFLLFALPGLVKASLFGEQLKHLRFTFLYIRAVSGPADVSEVLRPVGEGLGSGLLLEQVLIVIVYSLALLWSGRRERVLSGLALAVLVQTALVGHARAWVFGAEFAFKAAFAFLVFGGTLILGLRRMLAGWPMRSFLARFMTLILVIGVPLAILWAMQNPAGLAGFFRWRGVAVLLPGVLGATVASYRPPPVLSSAEETKGWTQVGYGLGLTLALLMVIHQLSPMLSGGFVRLRQERNQTALASIPALPVDSKFPRCFFQKGVNLTAEFPETYDSAGARTMLEILPDYGVNAVALVPYGFSGRGKPFVRLNPGAGSWESDEGLEQLSRIAHARGLKVMLKPGVWVPGGYAGDLEFASAADRAAWFADYQVFIEHYARLATRIHADILSVGVEFVHLSPYENEWRRLIARVRELYPGPLVYCANHGVEFELLKFWDALDYIGLQEYYPLPDDLSTDSVVAKVEAVQRRFGRPVLLTEVGFPSHEAPNREPWDVSEHREISLEAQARGYEAIFHAFYEKPWFHGAYWWAIRTDGRGGPHDRSLTPWGKPAMQVLKRWYQSETR